MLPLTFLLLSCICHAGHTSEVFQDWRKDIVFSPTHINPVHNPPEVFPAVEALPPKNASYGTGLERRDGPLYCNDGPCVDGSCCGKDHICGFGPDFCGTGCISGCNATAMCGEHSQDADMPCGMSLCCSATGWCGTTEVYCDNADPQHKTLPCQAGYGACSITPPPSCPPGNGGINGRHVGYFQSWNMRDRRCNKVYPLQLDTSNYTHLNYAFAFIDPTSFQVVTADPSDDKYMRDFTSLKVPGKLQTWIAIGGYDFSNAGTATHTTWSDMVSSPANRAAFISSLKAFMVKYGFQGVDLDWEYPGDKTRGGRELQDVRNFPTLVREMRQSFGSEFGISLALAPDYWYLRWFDAKAMENYVDFFGFMAYDLHGFWDADVKALGSKVRAQTDMAEIRNNTIPLWFDGLNPKKINLGLAAYGRGYTLSNSKCNSFLCDFKGPNKGGPCTGFDGVMSLVEIRQLISEKGLTPRFNEQAMIQELTWDDQWIGYDDEQSWAAKKAFADEMCFGGTMVWSIDFDHDGTGSNYVPPDTDDGPARRAALNRAAYLDRYKADPSVDCYREDRCVGVNGPVHCAEGYSVVGREKCPNDNIDWFAIHICCRTAVKPKSCTWRANRGSGTCNGQCQLGEMRLLESAQGGLPSDDTDDSVCKSGQKSFCCTYDELTPRLNGCSWQQCPGNDCPSNQQSIAKSNTTDPSCPQPTSGQINLCCPGDRAAPFRNCHWTPDTSDCNKSTMCDSKEVVLQSYQYANNQVFCNAGDTARLCCTPNNELEPFPRKEFCDIVDGGCPAVPHDTIPHDDGDDGDTLGLNNKRNLEDDIWLESNTTDHELLSRSLVKRGGPRWYQIAAAGQRLALQSVSYLGPKQLTTLPLQRWSTAADPVTYAVTNARHIPWSLTLARAATFTEEQLVNRYETDHTLDLSYIPNMWKSMATGVLPDGNAMQAAVIPMTTLVTYLQQSATNCPQGLPSIRGNNKQFSNLSKRIFTIMGTTTNRAPFALVSRSLNRVKGSIFAGASAMTLDKFNNLLRSAVATGTGEADFLEPMYQVIAVFVYLGNVRDRVQTTRRALREQMQGLSIAGIGFQGIDAAFSEYDSNYFEHYAASARNWVVQRILDVEAAYSIAEQAGTRPPNAARVRAALDDMWRNGLGLITPNPPI